MKIIKNLFLTIAAIIHAIYKVIDKFIITPVTKLALLISEKYDKGAGKFEKWISKRNTLIFVSLLLSLLLFFYVDNQASTIIDSAAEVLEKMAEIQSRKI